MLGSNPTQRCVYSRVVVLADFGVVADVANLQQRQACVCVWVGGGGGGGDHVRVLPEATWKS